MSPRVFSTQARTWLRNEGVGDARPRLQTAFERRRDPLVRGYGAGFGLGIDVLRRREVFRAPPGGSVIVTPIARRGRFGICFRGDSDRPSTADERKPFNGEKSANGETYDGSRLVAAHPTYPLGTVVRVTNPDNGRAVEVTVIDRSAAGAKRPNHRPLASGGRAARHRHARHRSSDGRGDRVGTAVIPRGRK